jgi:multiple sugar transport system permease protein
MTATNLRGRRKSAALYEEADDLDGRGPRENPLSIASSTLLMIVFAGYFLTPLWWLFVASSKSREDLSSTPGLWFGSTFDLSSNVSDMVSYNDDIFLRWLFNSFIYSGAGAAVGTFLAAMAGYALAKYTFPGREVYFNTVLAGVLVPATALALPLFLIFAKADAANTYAAVFIPAIVSPFGVYLARVYAASAVPEELLEAARLDGAGEFRSFVTIALRLMSPALVTIFLFQFVAIWNNFFLPLIMLQDSKLFPLTLGLYSWNTQIQFAPEVRLFTIVGSFVSVVPLVLVFLALQRFWRAGLAAGGVK